MDRRNINRKISSAQNTNRARLSDRGTGLRLVVVAIGLVLVSRLFYLQIIKHDYYDKLAIAEQQKKFTIPADRGSLYFRDGSEVVPGAWA
jgi:cell division protein FtsI/penicillin-binding protein 2